MWVLIVATQFYHGTYIVLFIRENFSAIFKSFRVEELNRSSSPSYAFEIQ